MIVKDLNKVTFFYGANEYYFTGFQTYRKDDGTLVIKVIGGISVKTGERIALTNNIESIKLNVV